MQKPQFVAQAESAALDRPYLPLADAILARMGLSLVLASGPLMPLPGWVAVGGSLAGNDISNSLESCRSSSFLDFRSSFFLDLRSCSVFAIVPSNRSRSPSGVSTNRCAISTTCGPSMSI